MVIWTILIFQEKLEWIFKMYDLNGDGTISMEEMVEVFQAIYDMVGHLVQLKDEVGPVWYILGFFKIKLLNLGV